ncbi:MAG: ribosome small subunit-dependent GTPase A [Acidimicrobiia bacterium]|nr:ribosome small subunit-dependent GTPase A [Acidimicrobiia bacterium]
MVESASSELRAVGWNDGVATAWAAADLDPAVRPGRAVRTSRRFADVATADGTVRATSPPDWASPPVTGDWLAVTCDEGDRPRIVAVLPRRTSLVRRDPSERTAQILAANIDRVLLTFGADRPIRPGRVERSLVLAWDSGAEPVLVLTKVDLLSDPRPLLDTLSRLGGGAAVLATSATAGTGLDDVDALVPPGATVVLVGESGAGKSTLVNRLAGNEAQETAEVRSGDAKGRHTTVTRDLIPLRNGGVLIDTPGIRSLGLPASGEGLAATFADIESLAADCRFRDCHHLHEPGCAVIAAADGGSLDADRLDRYRELRSEMAAASEPTHRR